MAIKCEKTVDLDFTTKCRATSTSDCSPILTGDSSTVEFINSDNSTHSLTITILSKKNGNILKNESVWSKAFSNFDFDFSNYNYQIRNVFPEYTFKYTECNKLTGVQSINADLSNGSSTFFDTVSVIVPFIVIMIMFALGFNFLKNLISKSSKGRV